MGEKLASTLIEGVGDDLLYGLVGVLIGVVPLVGTLLYWQYQRAQQQNIHPDSQENVQSVRDERQSRAPSPTESVPEFRRVPTDGQITCPVCLGDCQFAVQTNCGHIFCAECVITYWRTGSWRGAIRCPVCRQNVTVLLRCFNEEERSREDETKTRINNDVNLYNRRFSGEPLSWLEYIRDLPVILHHMFIEFFSIGGLVLMFRVRIVVLFLLALLYFLSPLDLIPEAAFGILGFIDDFFVLLLLAIYVTIIYRRFIAARAGNPAF